MANFWSCALLSVLALVCAVMCTQAASLPASGHHSNTLGSKLSVNTEEDRRHLCDALCGLESDWCPPSCPESVLHSLSGWARKRSARPFDDHLGNLSFEDYIFLKMLGRN